MSDLFDSETEVFITPREASRLAGVDPKTLTRWEEAGQLASIRTLGGHRRYRRSDIVAIIGGGAL